MRQQLGAQGAFQPVLRACRRCHSKVHLARRAYLHGRYRPQRRTVQLGDHLLHRCAPAVVLGAAQGTPGGGQLGQPHIPGGIKGKAGQLALHAQDGGSVPAIGAHKVAGALFQRSTVPRSGIQKAVLGADAVHALILPQLQPGLAVGGNCRLHRARLLPEVGGFISLRRGCDGTETQRIHQHQQDAHPEHRAGGAEPLEHGVPFCGHLGGILCPAARRHSVGAVGAPHPPVHEQRHPRPHREGRNSQYEQKFDQSDSHKRLSLSLKNLRTAHCPLSLKYSIPAQKGQAGTKRTAAQHRAAAPVFRSSFSAVPRSGRAEGSTMYNSASSAAAAKCG